jgi:hypothetical protein
VPPLLLRRKRLNLKSNPHNPNKKNPRRRSPRRNSPSNRSQNLLLLLPLPLLLPPTKKRSMATAPKAVSR